LKFFALGCIAAVTIFLALVGCATTPGSQSSAGSERTDRVNSREIKILYSWGVGGHNRLDSASGTFTKDLISDGTITVDFELSAEQKQLIAQRADSIGFWQLPDRITYPDSLEIIHAVQPYTKHLLVIWEEHRTKVVTWDTGVVDPIAERDRVEPLGALIRKMITESVMYKSLPKSSGGYL
jgi:hypothetical protein